MADTTVQQNDTIPAASADSLKQQKKQQSDIETTIEYSAKDSIEASIDGKMIWLYGEAKIKYGDIELEAEEITIDYANSTLTAHGKRDSLGQRVGYPVFKDGADLYETKDIVYNFKTGRARITEVVTQQGEGYLHVSQAFKNEKDELFSRHNAYTTCNLEHPHFQIISSKSKAIPGDKIVSGPFYMEFNGIPLPIGFLFGMFPAQRESKSGIIFPSYGEENRRGFNLRNGGYFFDLSEYIKLAVTGDIYSKGSHALYINSNYMKRYHYSGSVALSYTKTKTIDNIESPIVANDYRVAWTHTPQSKGNGRFSASVNAVTNTYNQNNNLSIYSTDIYSSSLSNISAKLNSRVSYSQKITGTPFSLGLSGSFSQDLTTREVDMPLPTVSLNMTNLYPFQRKDGKTGPLDNFSIGYSMTATNTITNNLGEITEDADTDSIAAFNMDNLPLFLKNASNGMKHSIPISTSHKIFKYFTVSPSVSYTELWYLKQLNWYKIHDPDSDVASDSVVTSDTLRHFNRVSNYSFSASFTTRVYGTYFFKKGNVKAIRHIVNPSISFGYTPNFATNKNYFNKLLNDDGEYYYVARHKGFAYGNSSTGNSGSIGFSLGNNLEMKVKNPTDSVARKVTLLNNLSFSTSYNVIADSFKLSNISISANSNILDNLINVNMSGTVDPYQYIPDDDEDADAGDEVRIDQYAMKGGKIGRLTSASLALSTNLNPKGREKDQSSREKIAKSDLPEQDKEFLMQNPDAYVDFEIPWSLRANYSLAYRHSISSSPTVTQSVQFSGDLSLSEKWKITFSSGYDISDQEFTTSNVSISRDLHCWTMTLNWVPFGLYQSYNFTIRVKSSLLQDLKIDRRKPYFDNL